MVPLIVPPETIPYPHNEAARTNARATLLYRGSMLKLAEQNTAIFFLIVFLEEVTKGHCKTTEVAVLNTLIYTVLVLEISIEGIHGLHKVTEIP